MLLFPTDPILLIVHIGTILFILSAGSLIHCVVLPKLEKKSKSEKTEPESPD